MDLVDAIRLTTENKKLTSLLIATLRHTGPVTLTKEEAEHVPEEGWLLKSEKPPDGTMTLWVENPRMSRPEV